MAMNAEPWFPSVIWNANTQGLDNSVLKSYAYERKKTDVGRSISNYGGWQSSDVRPGDCAELDKLVEYLEAELNEIATGVGLKPITVYNLWININPPGSYNVEHNHMNSVLSGVYYIDAHESQGNINFMRNDGAEYHLQDNIVEQVHHFNSSKTTYPAKTGALYVFPGWLKHSVDGNTTDKDRISISFNTGVK